MIDYENRELLLHFLQTYGNPALGYSELNEMLAKWKDEKEYLIRDLFRDRKIIKKPISLLQEETFIEEKFNYFIMDDPFIRTLLKAIYSDSTITECDKVRFYLGNKKNFILNRVTELYSDEKFDLIKTSKGSLKIYKGQKFTKVITGLAKFYELDSKNFINNLSMIKSECKIEGNLCLSIDPLDFFTASDNNHDWSSCIHWMPNEDENSGSHKVGALEMLYSPNVIVAYVESTHPMNIDGYMWNSKKWRQFVVVDSDIICGCRQYPYQNTDLGAAVLDFIAEEMDCSNYTEQIYNLYEEDYDSIYPSLDFEIFFNCEVMYNDFDGQQSEFLCRVDKDIYEDKMDGLAITYGYNNFGCAICGDILDNNEICCSECQRIEYCERCGEKLFPNINFTYYKSGDFYCYNCVVN